jgi:hypothetical protein
VFGPVKKSVFGIWIAVSDLTIVLDMRARWNYHGHNQRLKLLKPYGIILSTLNAVNGGNSAV